MPRSGASASCGGDGGLPQARRRDVGDLRHRTRPAQEARQFRDRVLPQVARPFSAAATRQVRGRAEIDLPPVAEAYLDEEDVPSLGRLIEANPDIARAALHDMGLDAPDALSGEPDALRAWLMEQLTVSVIVTAYNHAAEIGRCLDAVLDSRGLFRMQVVIGDDTSTDGTARSSRATGRATRSGSSSGPVRRTSACCATCRTASPPARAVRRLLRGGRLLAVRPQGRHADAHAAQRPQPRHVLQLGAAPLPVTPAPTCRTTSRAAIPDRYDQLPGAGQIRRSPPILLLLFYRAEALRRVRRPITRNASAADWLMNLYVAERGASRSCANCSRSTRFRPRASGRPAARTSRTPGSPSTRRNSPGSSAEGAASRSTRSVHRGEARRRIAGFLRPRQPRSPAGSGSGPRSRTGRWCWPAGSCRRAAPRRPWSWRWTARVQRIPVDVHRPDVIAAVLGDIPTTMEEARCGFRFTLPYALHLEVLISIEDEHTVVPWLS